jgi:hypothetical protein
MNCLMNAWQPQGERLSHSRGLMVPFSGPPEQMSRELYQDLLRERFQQLINENPKLAFNILTGSVEHNPDLYELATLGSPKDWPSQILACGQMQMCLDRVEWSKGQSLTLPSNEMPSLEEIVESLPH